jgi:hypothetical protein
MVPVMGGKVDNDTGKGLGKPGIVIGKGGNWDTSPRGYAFPCGSILLFPLIVCCRSRCCRITNS